MNSKAEFVAEYERLYAWRSLWMRLSDRRPKTERGKLQSRDDRVQRRALIANNKISSLMAAYDKWAETPTEGGE